MRARGERVGGGGPGGRLPLVVATRNPHKAEEIRRLLALPRVEFEDLEQHPEIAEVEEGEESFLENALRKARAVAEAVGRPALADDSGLEVDALGGAPGVRSARFAGERATDAANRRLLLERLQGVPGERRTARFVCVAAIALPGGPVRAVEGRCEGHILEEERGVGGFGYDRLFVPLGERRTFAQMDAREKGRFSHRGAALRRLRPLVRGLLRGGWGEGG